VPDILVFFGVVLTPLTGSLTVSNVAALPPGFLQTSAGAFAALLGVPPASLYATNLTDVATGASLQVGSVRRQLAGLGSLGVRVTFVARLGKTPTQAKVQNISAILASTAACAGALRTVVNALGAATMLGAAAYSAAVPASSIAVANAPFALNAATAAASSDSSGSSAVGGTVGGIVAAIALACAVWGARSYAKHGVCPCCRNRRREVLVGRQREAEHVEVRSALEEAERALEAEEAAQSRKAAASAATATAAPSGAGKGKGEVVKRLVEKARSERLERERAEQEIAELRRQLSSARGGAAS